MLYGIDIGGTKIETVIFDDEMNQCASWRVSTPRDGYQAFIKLLVDLVGEADEKSGEEGAVGIGIPGFTDKEGLYVSSNIPGINGKPLQIDLRRTMSRPFQVINDRNAFALSEAIGGAGEHASNVLGVILGTGLGGSLVVNGKVLAGRQNIAGEWGHVPIPATLQQRYDLPLWQCGCGGIGCLETYISGAGLLSLARHFGSDYADNSQLLAAMRENQPDALKAFTVFFDCLAACLAQSILYYEPDVVVLGGGLSNIEEIYREMPLRVPAHLFSGAIIPPILPPKFGDSSGARGAALLNRGINC